MHNFGTIFLWTLAACILLQGSFVEDQSGYICLIEDPKQKQCDSICLTELSPRLSEVVTAQNEGNANTRESDNEIKSKLETLEVNIGKELAKLPQEVHAKLEGRLQGVENKLERQFQVQTKLEESLLVVQTKLEAVLNQLQTLSKNIDSAKVEIPFGFDRIGTRFFRIVNEYVDWDTAKRRCVEMGGQLAVIQSEEEQTAIAANLCGLEFWLGVYYVAKDNEYVSVVTGHKAFLKWGESQPNKRINDRDENCICIYFQLMHDYPCATKLRFICQA
ncbi:collectin-46 [Drosophila kikkawai]|uniref:Collectin-46 n=1 Tax=Drosophila kikkawai TaxID=30033 RepID=A0A6P4IPH5_DROKI|nr:accessory gland protein Acp29AB [Drosophila kikkawai]